MKKNYLMRVMLLLSLFVTSIAWAQERIVKGKVTSSEDGSPVPGVNVVIKGTTNGTTTDADGAYTLGVPDENSTLVFSFIGLKTEEIAIGQRSVVDIGLSLDVTQLNEVVVVGYGTQQKRDLSGTIASVDGKDIASLPVQSFEQALAGRAAGVNITVPNGVLNNPPVIRIRGVNSISLSSFPLVVIDGIPTFTGDNSTTNAPNNPLSNINPADIESVEILKDASASAIYGSRATAGVILITTKRGSKGRSTINYDAWVGWTEPVRLINMLGAEDYMTIKNEGIANLNQNIAALGVGTPNTLNSFRPSYDADGNLVDTKWYDYVYRTGFSHSNSLSFSGGTDKTSYYLSLGHTQQDGMIQKNEFRRTNLRLNLDHKVYKNFTVGTSIGYSNNFNGAPSTGSLPGAAFGTAGIGRLPLVLPPNVSAYNVDGSYNVNANQLGAGANINPNPAVGGGLLYGYPNPAFIIDKNRFTSEGNQIQGSIYAAWEIIKGLTVRTTYGVDRQSFEDQSFSSPISGDGYPNGSATNTYRTNNRWTWQNTAQYDKSFGKHNLSLLLGGEQQFSDINRWGATRTIIADPFFESFQGNFTNIAAANTFQSQNYLVSYFSRFNYDFGKKYFASVNFRRDGYSAWASKYGNFYGAALGYAISEEDFWKNTSVLSQINFFKLKGSYGEVGNSNGINDFASLQIYGSGLYGPDATLSYNQAGNSALTWETSKKTDIGFSFGILQDRIQGEFAWYKNLVDGLILDVPQSPSKGIPNPGTANTIPANVGSMVNKGIEVSIKYMAINKGNFNWTVSANITTLENEVLTLTDPSQRIGTATSGLETVNYTTVGRSIGSILAVPTLGVNPANGRRLAQKADGTVVQYNHLGGGWTRVDNGAVLAPNQLDDGVYYNSLPKWYGGLDNTFKYKNFDLGLFLQFSGGNYIYNGTKAGLRDQRFWNAATEMMDRWTPENPNGTIPRVVYGDNVSNGSALTISENVEKGDFLRLKNVSLGYSLDKTLLSKLKMTSARVYGQVQNSLLFTNYTGFDPEISSNGQSNQGSGVDRNSVGQARTFTLGVNIGF